MSCKSKVENLDFTMLACIEGRSNEELPEVALLALQMVRFPMFQGRYILSKEVEEWLLDAAIKAGRVTAEGYKLK